MAVDVQVLSNFGVRYFLIDVVTIDKTTGTTVSASAEIADVLSCNPGTINKDVKTFKTLNGGGWDSAVSLGQSLSEGSMSLIRTGQGNAFEGGDDDSTATYNKLKAWVYNATKDGGVNAEKLLIEVVPRGKVSGSAVYEGTAYHVVPTSFDPGERNTADGQEYSINFQGYGEPQPLDVSVSGTGYLLKAFE